MRVNPPEALIRIPDVYKFEEGWTQKHFDFVTLRNNIFELKN